MPWFDFLSSPDDSSPVPMATPTNSDTAVPLSFLNAITGNLTQDQVQQLADQQAAAMVQAGATPDAVASATGAMQSFVNNYEGGTAEASIQQNGILGAIASSQGGSGVLAALKSMGTWAIVILVLLVVLLFEGNKFEANL